MRLIKTLFMAALFSCLASYSYACAVDSMSGKTDTTIDISWDLSGCSHVNSGEKFEICRQLGLGAWFCTRYSTSSGTGTISGLSASTVYKIRTKWHRKLLWRTVTTRTVTTDPSPTSSNTVLRYQKLPGHPYCVDFYWKNPPLPNPAWRLTLDLKTRFTGVWSSLTDLDLSLNAQYNSSTNEYKKQKCGFSNNRQYKAFIKKKSTIGSSIPGNVSNTVQWK